MKKQMGTLGSEDIDCSIKTSFTEEGIGKMLNLGNATVISNSYSNGKVTGLVIESNNHTFTLYSNNQFAMDDEKCNEIPEQVYQDTSGANSPELLDNMVAIKYDGTNWIVTEATQLEWYNYDAKEWANAVVLNNDITKNVGDTVSENHFFDKYLYIIYTYLNLW